VSAGRNGGYVRVNGELGQLPCSIYVLEDHGCEGEAHNAENKDAVTSVSTVALPYSPKETVSAH
jgi:hypothetical protein